jgi:hypothetical protein
MQPASGGPPATLFDFPRQIISVSDENGRSVSFKVSACPLTGTYTSGGQTYYADFGTCDTFAVTAPDGATTTYDYTPGSDSPDPVWYDRSPYRLRRWFTPSNPTAAYQVFAYDDAYRVKTVTDVLGHQTQYFAGGFADEPLKHAQAIDAAGNLSEAWYDQWNDNLESIDPLGRITEKAYDAAHRVALATPPELDCVATTYDLRSNALSSSHYPKGGCQLSGPVVSLTSSPGTPLTTSSTYGEASSVLICVNLVVCNKPFTTTDARGNTTNYSWDSGTGNLTQVRLPADTNGNRPETDLAYTSFNGAYLLTSKSEKISASTSTTTSYTYNASNKYVLSTATVDSGGLGLRTCFKFDAVGDLISTSDPRATSCP